MVQNAINSILIAGGYGAFLIEIINRFHKEGWRVFTIINDKSIKKPERVLEHYCFDIASKILWEVIESCRPNLIVHMGAHNPEFIWNDKTEKHEAKQHISGLSNLLMAGHTLGVERFIYLSGPCVFGNRANVMHGEDDIPAPDTVKGISILQGESLALSLASTSQMEIAILRMPDVVFVPQNASECTGRIAELCLNAVVSGKMHIKTKQMHSFLFVGDAVQAIFLLANANHPSRRLYHLPTVSVETEYDIARMVSKAVGREIPIIEAPNTGEAGVWLSGDAFSVEFSFTTLTSCKVGIRRIVEHITISRNQFREQGTSEEQKGALFKIMKVFKGIFPLLECVIVFVLVFYLKRFADRVPFLTEINIYLLYVFLFALLRGRYFAILAFALSIIGYLYQGAILQGVSQSLAEPRLFAWIVELFVVGIFTGGIRDRLSNIEHENEEEMSFFSAQLDDLTKINQSNVKLKDYFQNLTINSNESIGWFYEVISELDTANSGEVPFIAVRILSRILDVRDVSLYSYSQKGYLRLFSYTTTASCSMGKSIRKDDYPEFFSVLEEGKSFINRSLIKGLPSMASLLSDADGNGMLVFFLWNMPFDKMTLNFSNMLRFAQALIHNAIVRSMRYLDALAHERYIPGTDVLMPEAFLEMCRLYEKVSGWGMMEFTVLIVKQKGFSIYEWGKTLKPLLRTSDLVGLLKKNEIGILLINTSHDEAQFVIKRLENSGIKARVHSDDCLKVQNI